ncbi:aldo/keto reductase, putative [Talaromyces stipitatus ATCC 10500]|uniref:Aldo/keto reductase, putative n=1 Tax=Talaromyces stipitatus (strain ATCC 10500 / CBS 375.48 / QM 6759 / NRRL 1006) TaxID=441959 RepID=B8MS78_TALSN|nr:aldo/keto reductase, putative [Talaromyces stipitatus ATCC 10500]EED12136.1 aldo/keto reductase, putative [Talaromyces stipitatus ATCC 10500]
MPESPIPTRKLGKDGPDVPAIGFGLMGMTGIYGTAPSEEERFKILDRAAEIGATFWDTADIYGDNEEMLAKWFQQTGKRDKIFLATKFGIMMEGFRFKGINSSADYCKQQCDASLKRLGTDKIDLYYAHRLNHDTPIEETMRALAQLQAEGKIKYIGLSEVGSDSLRRAVKIAPVAAVQMEYSPFVRDIEGESSTHVLQTCRELGIAVVCYSPLGRGLLTGRFSTQDSLSAEGDIRAKYFPWFNEENFSRNVSIINRFNEFAHRKRCTPSQLAISWLLHQGPDIIPNPRTKSIKYLEDNVGALAVKLTEDEMVEIRTFLESNQIAGYRSTAGSENFAYVTTKAEN